MLLADSQALSTCRTIIQAANIYFAIQTGAKRLSRYNNGM